jgi:MFS family permease
VSVPSRAVPPQLRRARVAVSAVFFGNAVLYANLVPQLPEIKDRLDLSNAAHGSAIAAMPVGALLTGLFAPLFLRWFGSAKVAAFGLVALGLALAGLPLAGAWAGLVAIMLLGFALTGLGVATLVPAVMHTADELPGLPYGVGLTVIGFVLRGGFLVSPTLIGLVADAVSLRVALSSVAVAGLVVLVLGRVLTATSAHPSAEDAVLQGTPSVGPATS